MLLQSSLPSTTRHVLLTLSCHVNDAGEPCYPTIRLLAKETGRSPRVVMLHLDNGEAAGWITVGKHGFSGQKWATNEYTLAWPADNHPVDKSEKGGYFASPPFAEGGYFDDKKVVTQSNHLRADLYSGFPNVIPNTPLSPDGDATGGGFDRWWSRYPKERRIAKSKCARLWHRKDLEPRADQVIAVLASDVASAQWCRDDGQYIPLPMTWLSQDRFDREALPAGDRYACEDCGANARYQIGCHHLCSDHFNARCDAEHAA